MCVLWAVSILDSKIDAYIICSNDSIFEFIILTKVYFVPHYHKSDVFLSQVHSWFPTLSAWYSKEFL